MADPQSYFQAPDSQSIIFWRSENELADENFGADPLGSRRGIKKLENTLQSEDIEVRRNHKRQITP